MYVLPATRSFSTYFLLGDGLEIPGLAQNSYTNFLVSTETASLLDFLEISNHYELFVITALRWCITCVSRLFILSLFATEFVRRDEDTFSPQRKPSPTFSAVVLSLGLKPFACVTAIAASSITAPAIWVSYCKAAELISPLSSRTGLVVGELLSDVITAALFSRVHGRSFFYLSSFLFAMNGYIFCCNCLIIFSLHISGFY